MPIQSVNAKNLALDAGVDPKAFREALRFANLPWHVPFGRWEAERDSDEHEDMLRVLESLRERTAVARPGGIETDSLIAWHVVAIEAHDRGIQEGWYAMKRSGTLMLGPFTSRQLCLDEIALSARRVITQRPSSKSE